MSTTELDKDIAATMTPEELEAINAEASPEEQLIMRQQAEADAGDDHDSDDDDKDDKDEPEANKNKAGEGDAKAAEDDASVADKQDAPQDIPGNSDEFKPVYQAQLPEDFDARLADLTEREAALWAKFDVGEIERQDLQTQLRALESDRAALNTLRVKAEISSEMSEQKLAQEWAWNVKRFMTQAAKEDKIDYTKDAAKQAELDMFVKALGADPNHNDKTMEWFLQEAHRMVKVKNGIGEIAPPKKDLKQANEDRKPSLSEIPKTLAQVPGGDGPGDLSGEFANLDNLSGLELENALAKMTPTQRERYSQGL